MVFAPIEFTILSKGCHMDSPLNTFKAPGDTPDKLEITDDCEHVAKDAGCFSSSFAGNVYQGGWAIRD